MIGGLAAARVILENYATDLRRSLDDAGLTLRQMTAVCGVPTPTLSRICTGKHIPTVDEAAAIGAVFLDPETVDSARFTDPVSSHEVVRSICRDTGTHGRIVEVARMMWPHPFDDTDLTVRFDARWPRADGRQWQRGTLARARGRVLAQGLLEPVGLIERPERPDPRATKHFVWNKALDTSRAGE